MSSKSYPKKILGERKNDPNFKVLKVYKGRNALNYMKELLNFQNKKKANEWSKQFSNYSIPYSILIISEYKKSSKNRDLDFTYVIGGRNKTVVGHRLPYKKGKAMLQKLI